MRNLIVTASLASLLLSAPGASADEPSGGGARKLSQSEAKPAVAAAGVPATQIKTNLAPVPEGARTAGFKSTGGAPRLSRTSAQAGPKRLAAMTRVVPVRATKGLSAAPARTVSAADVPVTIVTQALTAAPRTLAAKRLAAPAGPALQATGSKLSAMGNLKGQAK